MTTLGIVIVTWNSADQIQHCLEAIRLHFPGKVVVVDNASQDQTAYLVSQVKDVLLLALEENLGFAGGVNQGVRALDTEYVLVLNPDCHLASSPLPLVEAARGGAAGGLLLGKDGKPQQGFHIRRFPTALALCLEVLGLNRLFPGNPVNRHYRALDLPLEEEMGVDQPPGGFLCFRRDTFVTVGGFDESYWPVWFEDVDFCRRLTLAGYQVRFTPEARAVHAGGESIRKIRWSSKELAWYGSLLRYATCHFGWLSRRMVGLAVAAASVPRSVMGIIQHKGFAALGVYARVWSLAMEVFLFGRVLARRMPLKRGSALQ
jgi:GT2 family glycosyltransferase